MANLVLVTGNKYNRNAKLVLSLLLGSIAVVSVFAIGGFPSIVIPQKPVTGAIVSEVSDKTISQSRFDNPILMSVLRKDGSYSFAKIENASIADNRYTSEVELTYQNGDSGIVTDRNGIVDVFIGKQSGKQEAFLLDRGVTGITLPDESILPVRLVSGKVVRGRVSGYFELLTLTDNKVITGKFDTRGKLSEVKVINSLQEPNVTTSIISKEILRLSEVLQGRSESSVLGMKTDESKVLQEATEFASTPVVNQGVAAAFNQVQRNVDDGSLVVGTQASPVGALVEQVAVVGPEGPQGPVGPTGPQGPAGDGDITGVSVGDGLSGGGDSGGVTLGVKLNGTGNSGSSSTTSGLELSSNGLSLLTGCSNGQVLAWSSSNGKWECSTSTGGTSGVSSLNSLTGALSVAGGGINSVTTSGSTITVTGTLPSVGTAGTYGAAATVPVITTDAQGRVSGVTNTVISGLTTSNFGSANISQWTNNSGYITDGNTNWDNSYGFITSSTSDVLTNKTISGASNTLSNIGNASLTNSSVTVTAGNGLVNGGSVSLGSSTTLNVGAGSGIIANADDLAINLTTTGTTGSTSSNSGMEVSSAGLTLLKGCADGQILKYADVGGWACSADSTGGSPSFDTIASGTNTTATMTVGTGGTLTFSGSGVVNASTLLGGTWAAPGTIGSGTPNTGAFTSLSSTGLTNLGTAGASNVNIATTGTGNTAIGNTTGTFSLISNGGLNVTTGGALTGVASVDTVGITATALSFAAGGTVTSTGANAMNVDGGATGALNLNGTSTGDILIGGGSASTGCTIVNSTGALSCTGGLSGSNFSGSSSGTNTGDVTLGAIGATPNANGALLTGQVLNLQPASVTFGGVVTTGTQSFAGAKTFSNTLTASDGLTLTTGALNLTSTSGALSLAGLSASSISTGANGLTFTSSNFNTTATGINSTNIGATTAGTGAFTTLSSTGTTNLGQGSGVVTINSSGALNLTQAASSTWTLNNAANALNIDSNTLSIDALNNRLGIGTNAPSWQYSQVGNLEGNIASIFNANTTNSTTMSVLRLAMGTAANTNNARFIQFYAGATTDSDGTGVGRIKLNNNAVQYQSGAADIAEYMTIPAAQSVSAGHIIAASATGNVKATSSNNVLIGVVSDTAAFVGGATAANETDVNSQIVGIAGFVNTYVTGTVAIGDPITVSSTAGVGEKATTAGYIIGKAAEAHSGVGPDRIKVSVLPGWYDPNVLATATDVNFGDTASTKTIDIGGVTVSGTDTVNISTNGTAADTITIGNSNTSTTVTITGGDDWSMSASGVLTTIGGISTTGTGTITSAGLLTASNGLTVSSGSISLPNGSIANSALANSSLTVTAGNGLTGGGLVSLGSSATISTNLTSSGTSANTSSNSGLEVSASGLALLRGCSSNQILKWNSVSSTWVCSADATGGSPSFDLITSGTNSTATLTVGTGGTLTFSGSGVVNASTLGGATFASPTAIGSGTASTGAFTTLSASSTLTASNGLTMTTGALSLTSTSGSISSTGLTGLTQTLSSGTASITAPTLNLNTSATGNTAIGNATGTFALTSNGGLNVTTGGALTGVASIDTIGTTATSLTFAGTGTLSTTNADLNLVSGTGNINIGIANQKTISIGNTTGTTTTNIIAGTGGILFTAGPTSSSTGIRIGNSATATPDLLVMDNGTADPTGTNGGMYYSSGTNKFRCYENGAWKDCDTNSGAAPRLDQITSATAGNTLSNADNAQAWNWSLTTAAKTGFAVGESAASTNGAGSQYLMTIGTLAASTANPFRVAARGNTIVDTTSTGGLTFGNTTANTAITLQSGTGAINIGTDANAKTITIGNTTGATTLQLSSGTGGINIGTGAVANSISIGTGAAAKTVTLGSTNTTSTLTLNAGTGGIVGTGILAQANGNWVVCYNTTTNVLYKGAARNNCDTSSLRFKDNIEGITLGLSAVNRMRPVSYVYKDSGTSNLGFIAEEIQLIDERLINRDENGLVYSLNTDTFIPILAKGIQELDMKLDNQGVLLNKQIYNLNSTLNGVATESAKVTDVYVTKSDVASQISSAISSVFSNVAEFVNKVIFKGDVFFAGRPTFNKDTAGFAVIKSGSNEVEVKFMKEYKNEPILNISLNIAGDVNINDLPKYVVADVNTKGFKIRMSRVEAMDLRFSWMAMAVDEVSRFESNGVVNNPVVPTATPTATTTPSVTPEISPSMTSTASATSIITPTLTPTPTPTEILQPVVTPTVEPAQTATESAGL